MRQTFPNVPAGQTNRNDAEGQKPLHRRVEITCEREVFSVLHDPALSITGHCVECGREVVKFTPELAAATSGNTPREIYRWLEEQKLHFDELTTGQVFVCSESLKTLHQT